MLGRAVIRGIEHAKGHEISETANVGEDLPDRRSGQFVFAQRGVFFVAFEPSTVVSLKAPMLTGTLRYWPMTERGGRQIGHVFKHKAARSDLANQAKILIDQIATRISQGRP